MSGRRKGGAVGMRMKDLFWMSFLSECFLMLFNMSLDVFLICFLGVFLICFLDVFLLFFVVLGKKDKGKEILFFQRQ